MNPRLVDRRQLLRGALGTALALPWLESLAPQDARAQTSAPLRFIVMFSPNGTLPSRWTPTGTERDFVLSPILSPLEAHQDDIVVLSGIDQQGGGGDGHQNGMGGMLTGERLNPGPFGGVGAPPAGWANGPSVDQRMAEVLGYETRLRSLELGVQVGAADNWGRMCYRDRDQPLPPEDDPRAVYERVFAELHTDEDVLARQRERRASILDAVSAEYDALSSRVSSDDRQRLQAHAEAVRDIEGRLAASGALSNPACEDPVVGQVSPYVEEAFGEVGDLMSDLLVMALSCDITRIASLQWSRSVSPTRFTWLGIETGHHDLSHHGDDDEVAVEALMQINQWYAARFADLLDKLSSVEEGEGTLLDNTLVLWCNELGKGNTHSREDAPYVLAGRAGGALETGRFLEYEAEPHNDLLVSLLNLMGIDDSTFGNPEWCNGPLAGLA